MQQPNRARLLGNIALTFLLAATLPAAAQTPSDDSLDQLINLQNIPKQLRENLPSAANMANQAIARSIGDGQPLSRTQQTELEQVADRYIGNLYRTVFQSENTLDEIQQISRNAMRTTYTQEEVDSMIAFYSTPIGQSILRKQSQLTQSIMPPLYRLLTQHIEKANQRLLPEFNRDIQRILRRRR